MLESSTKSASTLKLARRWIDECLQNHDACKNVKHTVFQANPFTITGPAELQLRLTPCAWCKAENCEGEPYATLSHSLGHQAPIMLNSVTHSLPSQGIHVSLLPQTFQDAIHITSSLGLKHIWIDSLYIVQDSKDDWEQESSMMCMVYSRALCNIAATASSSSDQGCFGQRDVSLVQPTIVDSCWMNHENYQLRVVEALKQV